MKPWLMLRALVYLKRITKALESIALTQSELANPPKAKRPKLAEVHTPSIRELNDMYREEHGYENSEE